ncbi:MAG: hypothetical protein HZY73_11835 [Micropruina sp.]|nr:MAG: hypothetical protein HZY73_11835 [Micropruina sp.]
MRWGRFRIEPDESGVRTVVSYGDEVWATLTVDGAQPAGRFTDDPDEVEHAFTIGRARLAIRHTVAEQWGSAGRSGTRRLRLSTLPSGCTWRRRREPTAGCGLPGPRG